MLKSMPVAPRRVRTLFLSDVHMGMRGTQVVRLVDMLDHIAADHIYLVGDIIDGWQLKKSWYWQPACNRLTQALLDASKRGTRITYIPGNHDDFLRDFIGMRFGGVEIADRVVHVTAQGQRYMVIHGDQFDVVVRHGRLLARVGDWSYNIALSFTRLVNRLRARLGLPNFSLSAWARANVRRAAEFVERFEAAVTHEAARAGMDGVICGHVHCAASRMRGGIHYIN